MATQRSHRGRPSLGQHVSIDLSTCADGDLQGARAKGHSRPYSAIQQEEMEGSRKECDGKAHLGLVASFSRDG